MKNSLHCLGFLLVVWLALFGHGRTAAQTTLTHRVQPGETWLALALAYGVAEVDLRALNPHPNTQRQPAIGTLITLPAEANPTPQFSGQQIIRPLGGQSAYALRAGESRWAFALSQGLGHPWRPLLYLPIRMQGETADLRELPSGFKTLTLSAVPAQPGEALAVSGRIVAGQVQPMRLTLGTAVGQLVVQGEAAVGVIGTGAFFRPGTPELAIQLEGEPLWVQPWLMVDREWTYNQLTLTGEAAQIDQQAIAEERERLFALWSTITPAPLWTTPFTEPISDYLEYSSLYGARRSYNGGPYRTYHEGLDFSAYGGTAVFAPAGGRVVLAETLYVRGGAVIIDHGLGIFTGYYHMSEVIAEVGQTVRQGDLIGRVGSTGLSTGNHLHWDLLINGIWVDPAAWRAQGTDCWILAGWGTPCPP